MPNEEHSERLDDSAPNESRYLRQERIAICMFDGGLSEDEAIEIALEQEIQLDTRDDIPKRIGSRTKWAVNRPIR